MQTFTCKGCRKAILYAKSTKSGATVPLDFDVKSAPEDLNPKGALFVLQDDDRSATPILNAAEVFEQLRAGAVAWIGGFYEDGSPFYVEVDRVGVNHYKTCPNAHQFGKGNR